MKKFGLMLLMLLLLLSGCTGGQEIESGLFVIAMAVDAAPEGNLTITVKALSGSQESAASGASGAQSEAGSTENLEQTETGYIVLSATAPSCLRALGLLGALMATAFFGMDVLLAVSPFLLIPEGILIGISFFKKAPS